MERAKDGLPSANPVGWPASTSESARYDTPSDRPTISHELVATENIISAIRDHVKELEQALRSVLLPVDEAVVGGKEEKTDPMHSDLYNIILQGNIALSDITRSLRDIINRVNL